MPWAHRARADVGSRAAAVWGRCGAAATGGWRRSDGANHGACHWDWVAKQPRPRARQLTVARGLLNLAVGILHQDQGLLRWRGGGGSGGGRGAAAGSGGRARTCGGGGRVGHGACFSRCTWCTWQARRVCAAAIPAKGLWAWAWTELAQLCVPGMRTSAAVLQHPDLSRFLISCTILEGVKKRKSGLE